MTGTAAAGVPRLLRFGVVGVIGFLLDAGATEILVSAGMGKLTARVAALALAIGATFLMNRRLTWRSERTGGALAAEGGRYVGVALAGAALNWLVYAGLVTAFPDLRPALGVAAGSVVAMAFTYVGYGRWVFGRRGG
jgi:putative flippase GtrA